jgi:hypothetical protein
MTVLNSKPLLHAVGTCSPAAPASRVQQAGRRGSRGNKLQQGLEARVSLLHVVIREGQGWIYLAVIFWRASAARGEQPRYALGDPSWLGVGLRD